VVLVIRMVLKVKVGVYDVAVAGLCWLVLAGAGVGGVGVGGVGGVGGVASLVMMIGKPLPSAGGCMFLWSFDVTLIGRAGPCLSAMTARCQDGRPLHRLRENKARAFVPDLKSSEGQGSNRRWIAFCDLGF
jgi:hypothetical protein